MAHEIAHLSQRHYARRLEQQERNTPLTIAGILAGIILTAATGSQAGIATIAGTQALAIDNMLRHSRAHEQEADRLGLELLAEAGYDPTGMPAMFERMLRQARLQGNRPPEYLSTHPLTESGSRTPGHGSRTTATRTATGKTWPTTSCEIAFACDTPTIWETRKGCFVASSSNPRARHGQPPVMDWRTP